MMTNLGSRGRTVTVQLLVVLALTLPGAFGGLLKPGVGGSLRDTDAVPSGPDPAWDELQECVTGATPLPIQALLRVYGENLQGPSQQHQATPLGHNVWAAKAASLFTHTYSPHKNYYWMDAGEDINPKDTLNWADKRTEFLVTLAALLHDVGKIGMWSPGSLEPTLWHRLPVKTFGDAVYEVEWAVQEHPLTGLAMCVGMESMLTADVPNCNYDPAPNNWWREASAAFNQKVIGQMDSCPQKDFDMRMHLSAAAERDIAGRIYAGRPAVDVPVKTDGVDRWFDFAKFFEQLGVPAADRARVCHMVVSHYSFGDVNKSGVSAAHAVMYARLSKTLTGDGSAADFKRRMGVFADVINSRLGTQLPRGSFTLAQGSLMMGYADIAGTMRGDLQVGIEEPTGLGFGRCEVCHRGDKPLFKELPADGKVYGSCPPTISKWEKFKMGPTVTFCEGAERAACDQAYHAMYDGTSAGTVQRIVAEYALADTDTDTDSGGDSSDSGNENGRGGADFVDVEPPVEVGPGGA